MVLGGVWGMENWTDPLRALVWAAGTGCTSPLVPGFLSSQGIFTYPVTAVFLGVANTGPMGHRGHAWITLFPSGLQPWVVCPGLG